MVDVIDFGRLSMACKGNRFSATRNAKVKAENVVEWGMKIRRVLQRAYQHL